MTSWRRCFSQRLGRGFSNRQDWTVFLWRYNWGKTTRCNPWEGQKKTSKKIFGKKKWTYQQDGATAHSAKMTTEWLEDNVTEYISCGANGDWPGNAPDLSYTEHLWAWMNDKQEDNPPQTKKACNAEWKGFGRKCFRTCWWKWTKEWSSAFRMSLIK